MPKKQSWPKWPDAELRNKVADGPTRPADVSIALYDDLYIIKISKRGEWHSERDGHQWTCVDLDAVDLEDFSRFIHALITRYNSIVRDMNKTASQCPRLESLKTIDE